MELLQKGQGREGKRKSIMPEVKFKLDMQPEKSSKGELVTKMRKVIVM
jgi:hypothetical protein